MWCIRLAVLAAALLLEGCGGEGGHSGAEMSLYGPSPSGGGGSGGVGTRGGGGGGAATGGGATGGGMGGMGRGM